MKVGILTLHSQINYGAVLQTYALQKVLRNKGYEVEVIDYWLTPANIHLRGECHNSLVPWFSRLRKIITLIVHLDVVGIYYFFLSKRYVRTLDFINQEICLSKQSYKSQHELKSLTGYDIVVVGSDQVWHPKYNPNPFLLANIDKNIRRISYAASFGVKEIENSRQAEYRNAWQKFHSVGVREKEGQAIFYSIIKRKSSWVLDPTLLLTKEDWLSLCKKTLPNNSLLCYWLGDINGIYPYLLDAAKKTGKTIILYTNLGLNCSGGRLHRLSMQIHLMVNRNITHAVSNGPREFLEDIAKSDGIITDSYHGLMFACIFQKPIQVFINSDSSRKAMAARFTDFLEKYGMMSIQKSLGVCHFSNFVETDKKHFQNIIREDRELSLRFLVSALKADMS